MWLRAIVWSFFGGGWLLFLFSIALTGFWGAVVSGLLLFVSVALLFEKKVL